MHKLIGDISMVFEMSLYENKNKTKKKAKLKYDKYSITYESKFLVY